MKPQIEKIETGCFSLLPAGMERKAQRESATMGGEISLC